MRQPPGPIAMPASAMGMSFGGVGAALGPAIVWEFPAGQHASTFPASSITSTS